MQRRALDLADKAYLVTGIIVLALGGYILREAAGMAAPNGYNPAGPELFPYIVGGAMVALGLVVCFKSVYGKGFAFEPFELHWGDVALVLLALALPILLLERLGWIISATLLFVVGARAFGAHRTGWDIVAGLVLAIAVDLLFAVVLDLRLPQGVFAGLFGG